MLIKFKKSKVHNMSGSEEGPSRGDVSNPPDTHQNKADDPQVASNANDINQSTQPETVQQESQSTDTGGNQEEASVSVNQTSMPSNNTSQQSENSQPNAECDPKTEIISEKNEQTEPETSPKQNDEVNKNLEDSEVSKQLSDPPTEGASQSCSNKIKLSDVASALESLKDSSAAASSQDSSQLQTVYHVKWINFNENHVPIITQNENGPCPLLAIMNVLLLQGKVKLPGMLEMVTSGQLMEYLGDCIFENMPKDLNDTNQVNWEQNMHDAMSMFHKLQTGLDVNVRFTGVGEFEYTNEMIVFDLLGIPLYHGWLVDPESMATVAAVGNCSYNQLVEKIIVQKSSERPEIVTEALEAEQFLEKSCHQLTYHGLSELVTTVREGQLCVLFRNNHFSTLYKRKNELFVLVTDQGFLTESNVVWESLSNVEGDGHFVDSAFCTYRKSEATAVTTSQPTVPVHTPQQMDQDLMLAMSLQHEQQEQLMWQSGNPPAGGQSQSDHELALRLQEEENKAAAARQQQAVAQQQQQAPRQPVPAANTDRKKSNDCTLL